MMTVLFAVVCKINKGKNKEVGVLGGKEVSVKDLNLLNLCQTFTDGAAHCKKVGSRKKLRLRSDGFE